jgi:hypothetical protein
MGLSTFPSKRLALLPDWLAHRHREILEMHYAPIHLKSTGLETLSHIRLPQVRLPTILKVESLIFSV